SRPSIGRNRPKQCATIPGCLKRYASPQSVAKCFSHTCASVDDTRSQNRDITAVDRCSHLSHVINADDISRELSCGLLNWSQLSLRDSESEHGCSRPIRPDTNLSSSHLPIPKILVSNFWVNHCRHAG